MVEIKADLIKAEERLKDVYKSQKWMMLAGAHSYLDFELLNLKNDLEGLIQKVNALEMP